MVTLLIIWIFLLCFKTTLSLTSSSFSLYTLSYFVSCSHTFMTLMFQFISIIFIVRCCSIIFRYFILLHHLMLNYYISYLSIHILTVISFFLNLLFWELSLGLRILFQPQILFCRLTLCHLERHFCSHHPFIPHILLIHSHLL